MTIKKLQNTNWEFYLERKSCIFYVSVFFEAYKNTLKRVTGYNFEQQLLWCKDEYVRYYREKKAVEEAKAYFIKLVEENDPRLEEWHEKGIELLKKEDAFIEKTKKMTSEEDITYLPQHL